MRYNRTLSSRLIYRICTYTILVGWPLWMKLMTIDHIKHTNPHPHWNPWGSVEFVGEPLGTPDNCASCHYYPGSARWPIQVQVNNVSAQSDGAQYVITFTSDKWEGPWYQSSQPTILNSVQTELNQTLDVCKVPAQLTYAPSLEVTPRPTSACDDDDSNCAPSPMPAPTPSIDDAVVSGEDVTTGAPAARVQEGNNEEVRRLTAETLLPPYVDASQPEEVAAYHQEQEELAARVAKERASVADAVAATAANGAFYQANKDEEGSGLRGKSIVDWATSGSSSRSDALTQDLQRHLASASEHVITGDDYAVSETDQQLMKCCHGRPGPAYVVACVIDNYFDFATLPPTKGPPFDDTCLAVVGACGGSCGTKINDPPRCENGRIPLRDLIGKVCTSKTGPNTNKRYPSGVDDYLVDDDDSADCGALTSEDDFEIYQGVPVEDTFVIFGAKFYFTQTPPGWHWVFMIFMFMSYVSITVASLPGAGVTGRAAERLPSLHTLDKNPAILDGVKCISFSISASENKVWVLRNVVGKVASGLLHPFARQYDFFQDEGTRAGCYALWDTLVHFLHVEHGRKEDTVGMCKFWAARLRDPSDQLSRGLDSFKKDSEAAKVSMVDIERNFDAFEDMHESAAKFGIPESKLSMLHFAYELYELVNCLGDRRVWSGWDVPLGSKEHESLKLPVDDQGKQADPTTAKSSTASNQSSTEADAGSSSTGRTNNRPSFVVPSRVRGASMQSLGSVAEDGGRYETPVALRAQAYAERSGVDGIDEEGPTMVHLDGLKDWLNNPSMSGFVLQWAHSLIDVAYTAKKPVGKIDPFSADVLAFAKLDATSLACAQSLKLLPPEAKVGDKKGGDAGKASGRFLDAYDNFKKTTGEVLYDFIDQRDISLGVYRGSHHAWVPATLMYGTRAKPERRDGTSLKKRNLQPGVYACLNGDIELPSYPAGLSKWEGQRRCYGKVREILADRNVDGRRVKFVELSTLSEDMIANKPYLEELYSDAQTEGKALWSPLLHGGSSSSSQGGPGGSGGEEDGEYSAMDDDSKAALLLPAVSKNPDLQGSTLGGGPHQRQPHQLSSNAFIQLPLSILAPLLRCRGKAGGMNFAVKVLEEREHERAASDPMNQQLPSLTLFAIFDCRHMVTPGFWEQTILHFFRERAGEVSLQPSVKYCQVPQNFIGVELATDYLDMQNEYLFRYVNCMRDGVGCVTSCGTNCVWAIEKGFEYEERTMIEDTATSHKVILEGYEGTYHYEKLIFGTPKDNKDFLAAIFRWSRGAVQLFWLAVFGGRTEGSSAIPFLWVVLVLMVLPMAVAIFGMLSCTGNGIASVRAFVAIYVLYFVLVTFMWTLAMSRRFGHLLRYVVLFDNSTYFFNTWPAYFWCLVLPGYMCNAGDIPFKYSLVVVSIGGLLWEVLQWINIIEVKGWSVVAGQRPKDISILRSQQMYFVNCPLHGVAFYSGSVSAYKIIMAQHDASSWSSFGHGGPGDWIVNWLIFLVSFLCLSILSATIQLGLTGLSDVGRVTSYGVGIVTAMIFLALVFDPACILISGKTRTVTLKHAYFIFWFLMVLLGTIILGLGIHVNISTTV